MDMRDSDILPSMSLAMFQMCKMNGGRRRSDKACFCDKLCSDILDCPVSTKGLKSTDKKHLKQLLNKSNYSQIQTDPKYKDILVWHQKFTQWTMHGSTDAGSPLIAVESGNVLCQHCEIEGGPAGGPLADSITSKLFVKECRIHGFEKSGIEAREEGSLIIMNSKIYANEMRGVLAGPDAQFVRREGNEIFNNSEEGILIPDYHYANKAVCVVQNNVIHHNSIGISAGFLKRLSILNN